MKKITQDYKNCIGCGTCVALCPKYFGWGDDGKAILVGGKENKKGEYELEVKELDTAQDAADACPVQVIRVEDVK